MTHTTTTSIFLVVWANVRFACSPHKVHVSVTSVIIIFYRILYRWLEYMNIDTPYFVSRKSVIVWKNCLASLLSSLLQHYQLQWFGQWHLPVTNMSGYANYKLCKKHEFLWYWIYKNIVPYNYVSFVFTAKNLTKVSEILFRYIIRKICQSFGLSFT